MLAPERILTPAITRALPLEEELEELEEPELEDPLLEEPEPEDPPLEEPEDDPDPPEPAGVVEEPPLAGCR